jgi:hypothetical protein
MVQKRSVSVIWYLFPQILDLSLLTILSAIRHFFAMDESQARGPSARVRLSKIAGLM